MNLMVLTLTGFAGYGGFLYHAGLTPDKIVFWAAAIAGALAFDLGIRLFVLNFTHDGNGTTRRGTGDEEVL